MRSCRRKQTPSTRFLTKLCAISFSEMFNYSFEAECVTSFFPESVCAKGSSISGCRPSIFTSSHHILNSRIFSSSHPHIFTSSHLHIFSSSHLHSLTSSHLHSFSSSQLLIFTSSHLHTLTSSHLLIFTSSHLHICTSSHLHITSSHLHSTSSHLLTSHPHIFTFSLALLLSPSFLFLS